MEQLLQTLCVSIGFILIACSLGAIAAWIYSLQNPKVPFLGSNSSKTSKSAKINVRIHSGNPVNSKSTAEDNQTIKPSITRSRIDVAGGFSLLSRKKYVAKNNEGSTCPTPKKKQTMTYLRQKITKI